MGIDIVLYRARIGAHNLRAVAGSLRTNSDNLNLGNVFVKCLKLLVLLLIGGNAPQEMVITFLLLFLSGDIELNPGPTSFLKENNLQCLYINARSVKSVSRQTNKLKDFHNLIFSGDWDLVFVTETWLINGILDSEICPPGYQCFRKDRDGYGGRDRGGGLLLLAKSGINIVRHLSLEPRNEILIAELKLSKFKSIGLVVCYHPQWEDLQYFNTCLKSSICATKLKFKHTAIIGDFNLPELSWHHGVPSHQLRDDSSRFTSFTAFVNLVTDNAFVQLNNVLSNLAGNQLDLVLVDNPEFFTSPSKYDFPFKTDHSILNFTINNLYRPSNTINRWSYDFKNADFVNLKIKLNSIGHQLKEAAGHPDLNIACKLWSGLVTQVTDLFIPKIKLRNPDKPPWIDGECTHLRNRKLSAWRKCKRTNKPTDWACFRALRNKLQKLMDIKYDSYINSFDIKLKDNPKKFWSLFKIKTKAKSLPNTLHLGDQTATEPLKIAELFNQHFFSVFSKPDSNPLPALNHTPTVAVNRLVIPQRDVLQVLKELDTSKAVGPDGFSPKLLKECGDELCPSLTIIFNNSLLSGSLPDKWKEANVVPVFKKGDKADILNYRPISLLCLPSKILERCIFNHLYSHLSHVIVENQHGFRKQHSTVTQLLQFMDDIHKSLDKAGQIDLIYLDFAKAFDSVNHRCLLHKLQMYGLDFSMLNWINAYLTNRRQRVIINSQHSSWKPVLSGVPQGSILGPLLFLLYINDLPSVTRTAKVALFADDVKCSKVITSVSDCRELQGDLDVIGAWSATWRLRFSPTKCSVLTVSRKLNPIKFDYLINMSVIARVTEVKDLGVTITKDLKSNMHCRDIKGKAMAKVGMIKRTLGACPPLGTVKQLFISLVRSTLEYGSQVWSPHTSECIKLVESVQRRATKYMLGYADINYKDRLLKLNILPLTFRREILDLTFLFKCINNLNCVELSKHLARATPGRGLRSAASDAISFKVPRTRTVAYEASYFVRVSKLWNLLDTDIRLSPSVGSFKVNLNKFYLNKLKSSFDPDDICSWSSCCLCTKCSPF